MQLGDDGNIYCVINEHVWRFNLTSYRVEEPDVTTQERYRARINVDPSVQKEHVVTVGGRRFDRVRQVFMDSQRNAWVMGLYGVYKATPAPQPAEMVPSVPKDIVRCIFTDSKKLKDVVLAPNRQFPFRAIIKVVNYGTMMGFKFFAPNAPITDDDKANFEAYKRTKGRGYRR